MRAAKRHLLTRAIATASPLDEDKPTSCQQPRRDEQLGAPDRLLDLLQALAPFLQAGQSLSPDTAHLLLSSPPLSYLEALLPDLGALLSANIAASALNLARVAGPAINPSSLHCQVASLSQDFSALAKALDRAQSSLSTARLATLSDLVELLDMHAQCLVRLVRLLETKHGVVAHHLELRASDASLQAQRGKIDAEQALRNVQRDIYTPETVAALRNYTAHLSDAKIRSNERIRGLKFELAEYGVGVKGGQSKERKLREMAMAYRDMSRQMGDVKGDLDRLWDH